jgi:hypothetical protein
VARRLDLCSGQIYRWRPDLRAASNGFAAVVVAGETSECTGRGPATIEVAPRPGAAVNAHPPSRANRIDDTRFFARISAR